LSDWREFDQNPVSHSAAHHLTTIQQLHDEFGYARVSDVARHLGITRGSVSVTLKGLRQRGLVVEDDHKHLSLSEEGLRIARGIRIKRILIQALFREVLGIPDEVAETDACKVEHLVSDVTAISTAKLLKHIEDGKSLSEFSPLVDEAASGAFPDAMIQEIADQMEGRETGDGRGEK